MEKRDALSGLVDGELTDAEARALLAKVRDDASLRDDWSMYHLIGDAMRGEVPRNPSILGRVGKGLALEATVLAPRRFVGARVVRFAFPVAAAAAAAGMVGWLTLSGNAPGPGAGAEFASAPRPAPLVVSPVASSAAPQFAPQTVGTGHAAADLGAVREYLIAHEGVAPSAMRPGGYIRGVSNSAADVKR
jgi:sigma-E factor negative regulatory protein RseA